MPPARASDGIEYKHNPWHDPKDGRFTSASLGTRGAAHPAAPQVGRGGTTNRPSPADRARVATTPRSWNRYPAVEFVAGAGEGLSGVAKGTVAGAYSALTTNPVTTVRTVGLGLAHKIDMAIAAGTFRPARSYYARRTR